MNDPNYIDLTKSLDYNLRSRQHALEIVEQRDKIKIIRDLFELLKNKKIINISITKIIDGNSTISIIYKGE